ncbi:10092_t:CDS:2 [Scutellospora calospora]|uniref:10092_t:CDS:1 n=1 Tax=Scutellospora calospora TaxID=85575 RepID=A0ACA9K0S7_9GLOM|nr:10092_t:CDS:2 [Scutellospora calospora]
MGHRIWKHFTKLGIIENYKQPRAKCNYCGNECNDNVIRCEGHLKICEIIDSNIKQQYFNSVSKNIQISVLNQNIQSFVDRISPSEQNDIELEFAQAIFQCGLPLSLSALKPIQELFKKIRPSFKLPSRKKLSTTLLEQVYKDTKTDVDNMIKEAEYISIIIAEHWTNYLLAIPKPVFVLAKPTGEVQQNSINIANEIENIIKSLNIEKISAVITDNAFVMKKSWSILAKKYPTIIFLGCLAHSINLLIGDIVKLDWAQKILSNAILVIKFFRQHIIPAAILKRYQQTKYGLKYKTLKFPVKTRWGSAAICLDSIKSNQLAISLAATELINHSTTTIDLEIKEIIQDNSFWDEAQNLLAILKVLANGITLFESDTSNLSQFYKWYETLKTNENLHKSFDYEKIYDIITKRWNIIYDPVIEIAYLLDSRFQGKSLANDIMTTVSDFIEKYYPKTCTKIYSQLLEYLAYTGPFNNNMAWETVNTTDQITWWTGNFLYSAPELTQFAKRILMIPTSSAASERNWSVFSYIHSKNRNRLISSKVFKLVYIYSNYRLKISQYINEKKLDNIKNNESNSEDSYWENFFSNNEDELELLDDEELLDNEELDFIDEEEFNILDNNELDFLNENELDMEFETNNIQNFDTSFEQDIEEN